MARLNMTRSHVRPFTCTLVRIDQTCLVRRGGFAPTNLPWDAEAGTLRTYFQMLLGHTPLTERLASMPSMTSFTSPRLTLKCGDDARCGGLGKLAPGPREVSRVGHAREKAKGDETVTHTDPEYILVVAVDYALRS